MDFEKLSKVFDHVTKFSRKWHKQRKLCVEKLTKDLFEFGYNYFPKEHFDRQQLSETLHELAGKYAEKVADCLDEIWCYFRLETPANEEALREIKPISRVDAEQNLREALQQLPEEDHEFVTKFYWDEYFVKQKKDEQLVFQIHQHIKDVLMNFFSEEILMLKPEHFRILNNYTFHFGAWDFVDELSDLKIKNDNEEYLF